MLAHQMNTYSTNSPNPYAKRYLTKGRRSITNANTGVFLESWPSNTKRMRKENDQKSAPLQIIDHQDLNVNNNKTEAYNFLADETNYIQVDYINELYDSNSEFDRINIESSSSVENNYMYLNEDTHDNIINQNDENTSVFIDGNLEEYSIDFIEDAGQSIIDNLSNMQFYQDQSLMYNSCSFDNHNISSKPLVRTKNSKRKQGIVGRPTLSSPQRLLVPDNVYSYGNQLQMPLYGELSDNYITNYRNFSQTPPSGIVTSKPFSMKKRYSDLGYDHDDNLPKNGSKSRPRILSKPSLTDYRQNSGSHMYSNATEQDALEIAQRMVANREFARNLVKRAERQGTVIDKNKIPNCVFEQQPVEVLMKSALNEQLSVITEIKNTEPTVPHTYTTVKLSDNQKMPTVVIKKSLQAQSIHPQQAQMTASDILKQKWKAASLHQS